MHKYFVNNIKLPEENIGYKQRIIALYKGGFYTHKGSFCGWYASEKRIGAKLLGYFIVETPLTIDKGKPHLKEVQFTKPKRRTIQINSIIKKKHFLPKTIKKPLMVFLRKYVFDNSVGKHFRKELAKCVT